MEELFINVLKRSGATIDNKRDTITEILDYEDALRMALDIGAQLEAAEAEGKGYISVGLNNIRRLGNGSFILINESPANIKNDKLVITTPFKYTSDMAPELALISRLPAKVSPNVSYYSLVKNVLRVLDIGEDIERLRPTKLYYLIKRATEQIPNDRIFIYI